VYHLHTHAHTHAHTHTHTHTRSTEIQNYIQCIKKYTYPTLLVTFSMLPTGYMAFQNGPSLNFSIRGSTQNSGNLTIKIFFTGTLSFHSLLRSSPLGCLNSPNVWGLLRRRLWKLGVLIKKFYGQIPRILRRPSYTKV
jgi:hypothetical protein